MALNDFFNVKIDKDTYEGDIVEIGRFVILKKHRVQSRLATLALLRIAHRYSIKNDIRWWTGCASEALLKSFNGFVKYEKLTQYPINHSQENLRKEYEGYFSHKVIPFMVKVKEISPYRGLMKMKILKKTNVIQKTSIQ